MTIYIGLDLGNRDGDETLEAYVAVLERIRAEIIGECPSELLHESEIWGDSTLSLHLAAGDSDEDFLGRQDALCWALAESLPKAKNAKLVRQAISCMKQHGSSFPEQPEHSKAFCALLQVLEASPTKMTGDAWRFFTEQAEVCVDSGIAQKETVRRVLSSGHRGKTKKIVASALETLGGPL